MRTNLCNGLIIWVLRNDKYRINNYCAFTYRTNFIGTCSIIGGAGDNCYLSSFFLQKRTRKTSKVQDSFLREQRINMAFSSIRIREIHRNVFDKGKIILRKDRAVIFSTSSFRSDDNDQYLEEIEKLLTEVLKNCYSNRVIMAICEHNIHLGDKVAEVNLRHECGLKDLRLVLDVNKKLEKYGLYLSLLIE